MKTKLEIIDEYKKQFPKLYKGIDNETFELNAEEYESACERYAETAIQIAEQEANALNKKNVAEAKLAALGLTAEDLKALGL